MKSTYYSIVISAIAAIAVLTSCSKKSTPMPAANSVAAFWHGYLGSSPNQVDVAILLRANGTAREYDNDFFTTVTTMAASDTANAKFKLDGTYTTSAGTATGTINIVITYFYSGGGQQHTYSNTGVITGSTMTGTWKDNYVTAGINTTNNFSLTK